MKTRLTTLILPAMAAVATLIAPTAPAQSAPANPFEGRVKVNVSLKDNLTSRTAKEGQPVIVTLEQPATIQTLVLPRGSQLIGHVVEVTKHSKETPNGAVSILFDTAKPKKADPVPILASVYQIMPSVDQMNSQRADVAAGMRGTAAEAYGAAAVRQTTDANGKVVSGTVSASSAPVQVVSAIPGVALSAVAGDTKSAIFTAKNDEVALTGGINMVIGVALKP
jgi:hypothetical protein